MQNCRRGSKVGRPLSQLNDLAVPPVAPAFAGHLCASQQTLVARYHHGRFPRFGTLRETVPSLVSEFSTPRLWSPLLAALPDLSTGAEQEGNELTFKKACRKIDTYLTVPQAFPIHSDFVRDGLCVEYLQAL